MAVADYAVDEGAQVESVGSDEAHRLRWGVEVADVLVGQGVGGEEFTEEGHQVKAQHCKAGPHCQAVTAEAYGHEPPLGVGAKFFGVEGSVQLRNGIRSSLADCVRVSYRFWFLWIGFIGWAFVYSRA